MPETHCDYKPLHCSHEFNLYDRKLKKMLARSSWYDDLQIIKKLNWRPNLPANWKGDKPMQYRVNGMKFASLMQVPNSPGGQLINMLAKAEPRLAKASGYQIKLVEKSGKPLSYLFPKNFSSGKCQKAWCGVCSYSSSDSPILCNVKSVVYNGICKLCDTEAKKTPGSKHQGIYVGQTYRTLSERSKEHRQSLKNMELGSFMFKHWCLKHPDLLKAPDFEFKVVARHKDPLSRMVEEGVMISECATLNSKSEWKGYRVARLSVEKTDAQKVKELATIEQSDRNVKNEMLLLKERAEVAKISSRGDRDASDKFKNFSSCRKRPSDSMRQSGALAKRLRIPRASSTPVRHGVLPILSGAHTPPHPAPAPESVAPVAPEAQISPSLPASPVRAMNEQIVSPKNSPDLPNLTPGNSSQELLNSAMDMLANASAGSTDTSDDFPSEASGSSATHTLNQAMDCDWWRRLNPALPLANECIGKGVLRRKMNTQDLPGPAKRCRLDTGETFSFVACLDVGVVETLVSGMIDMNLC